MNTTRYYASASDRALVLPGLPADSVYRFSVQAYRKVASDINASGVILSPVATSQTYQPETMPRFLGDIQGTIQGRGSLLVVQNLEAIASDSVLSTAEKPGIIVEYNSITARLNAALSSTGSAVVTPVANARAAAITAKTALDNYLTSLSPAWNDTAHHTPIVASAFQAAFASMYASLANLESTITHNLLQSLALTNDGRLTYQPMAGGNPVDLGQINIDDVTSEPVINAVLSSDSVTLWAYANGSVVSYEAASGFLRVYAGKTDISTYFNLSTSLNPQNLSVEYSGQQFSITAGLDASETTASLTIKGTGTGYYSGVEVEKTFTITKVIGGHEVVATLPANNDPKNFIGRRVFDETTQKLYTFKDSGWVPDVDLSEISALQIADGSITLAKFAEGVEPVALVQTLPTSKVTNAVVFGGKIYTWNGSSYSNTVDAAQIDARGLDILDENGVPVFSHDGTIGSSVNLNVNGNNILLSEVASNALTPSLYYVGAFSTPPTQQTLGAQWRQNAVYKNTVDDNSYVLTGSPLGWSLYLESGTAYTLLIESSAGTVFRFGQGKTTILKARLFKNGAEVTDQTPEGWFRWRRVSGIPQQPPNDDATWNALYQSGYKQIAVGVDQVFSRATFFCDVLN